MGQTQHTSDLFRAVVSTQPRHHLSMQPIVECELAWFGSTRSRISAALGDAGPIVHHRDRTALAGTEAMNAPIPRAPTAVGLVLGAVLTDLPTDRRGRTTQPRRDRTNRLTNRDPSSDLLPLDKTQPRPRPVRFRLTQHGFYPAHRTKPPHPTRIRHPHSNTGIRGSHPLTDQIPKLPQHRPTRQQRHATNSLLKGLLHPSLEPKRVANSISSPSIIGVGGCGDSAGMGCLDEPFPGSWARAAGLVTRWELERNFVRVFPDVYLRKGCTLDARGRARAAAHWAKGSGVLIGYSAAAMYGTKWLDPNQPAEIARTTHCKPPCGIRAVRTIIGPAECGEVDGFRVTTPARTAFDLGRRLPRDQAVPILDALCAATGLHPKEVAILAREHPGVRGVAQLSTTLQLVDAGAESPPESHTRLLLIDDGLPRPTTQLVIRDSRGGFIARVDLGWERWHVAVEYDGAHHWTDPTQRTKDIDRIATLESLGWRVIRVNATLLHHRPHVILERVRTALHAHGWTDDQRELVLVNRERARALIPPDHENDLFRGNSDPILGNGTSAGSGNELLPSCRHWS